MEQKTLDTYLVELRDNLALEAMKIILADSGGLSVEKIAIASYQIADAMLEARIFNNIKKMSLDDLIPDHIQYAVRTKNCLKNYGITTVDELIKIEQNELLKIPNLGIKCLNLINNSLKEMKSV